MKAAVEVRGVGEIQEEDLMEVEHLLHRKAWMEVEGVVEDLDVVVDLGVVQVDHCRFEGVSGAPSEGVNLVKVAEPLHRSVGVQVKGEVGFYAEAKETKDVPDCLL